MLRQITSQEKLIEVIRALPVLSELLEEENGKPRYCSAQERDILIKGKRENAIDRMIYYLQLLVYGPSEEIMHQGDQDGNKLYIAVSHALDVCITDHTDTIRRLRLLPGEPFGGMSLLADAERKATISVPPDVSEAQVLEISRVAIPFLRNLPRFAKAIDESYRARGFDFLISAVQEQVGEEFEPLEFQTLRRVAEMKVYGANHVLCLKTNQIDYIYLIKDGWVQRQHNESLVDVLGAGNCLGLEWQNADSKWEYTATAKARTEVLEISLSRLLPDRALLEKVRYLFDKFSDFDSKRDLEANRLEPESATAAKQEIETGIVDVRNLLVMDMDKCVRCGNCSLACQEVHGQSRLVRRGISISRPVALGSSFRQHVLLPQVCLQCKNPECLVECPTGAIHRDSQGLVDITAEICTGCMRCAAQCPYNAIWMIPRENEARLDLQGPLKESSASEPQAASVSQSASAKKVAAKCNLCENTPLNPPGVRRQAYSCEENCPTGALVRVDPREYFDEIQHTIGKEIFRNDTQVIGRNIHKSDPLIWYCHILGSLLTIGLTVAGIWTWHRYGLDTPMFPTRLSSLRWLAAFVGLAGIVGALLYSIRRRLYRNRWWPLRYWRLLHVYFGIIAAAAFLLHGGTHWGGWLTRVLYISFDSMIITGLFGGAAYYLIPRIMTSIEEEPLLIEDLIERRGQLREEIDQVKTVSDQLRQLIERRVNPQLRSLKYLVRQYVYREELATLLDEAGEKLRPEIQLLSKEHQGIAKKAIENSVVLSRVESLVYLHRVLKWWLIPHVSSTAFMLAFLVAHIVQVVFFLPRR